jgi:hypothetical protein
VSTTLYVARFLGVDTGAMTGAAVVGTIVGGDDALDTRDGDTSYVIVRRDGALAPSFPTHTEIPFRWEKVSGPTPNPSTTTSITLESEYRKDDATDQATAFATLGTTWDGIGTSMPAPWGFAFTTDYVLGTSSVDPFYTEALTDGRPWVISPAEPGLTTVLAFRLTYLVAVVEGGESHLRQKNRDSIRARNRASRQRGIRARGYY